MTKAPIDLQDLRRRIYVKAKAEPSKRFWGLYVHICKPETLRAAYALAKANDGAPGIDGVSFEQIEREGVEAFLETLRGELTSGEYQPLRNRKRDIPKEGGKVRTLSIPAVRDRVVQGALKLILEPIFEADFQPGSFGYRPRRCASAAIERVAQAIAYRKTRIIDVDLSAYFDNVRHDLLLTKVVNRIDDDRVMALLKRILKATGKRGVPQGGVISPLLSNLYLNEVDRMLERAKTVTRDRYTHIDYARYADDLVVLVDGFPRHEWLVAAANRRLREEFSKLGVQVNEEKSRVVDLTKGESFAFLGFDFRWVRSLHGNWQPLYTPRLKKRTELLRKVRDIMRRLRSRPTELVIRMINPILRGWVSYFRHGHSGRCFRHIREWVAKKIWRHLMRAQQRKGFGWKRWSKEYVYGRLGLFDNYRVSRHPESAPSR